MIEIHNLNYKDILFDINVTIPNHLTIVGENGTGKSTLAKLICGLIPNDAVLVNHKPLDENKNRATTINYIPATFEVYDENLKVIEYLQSAYYNRAIKHNHIQTIMQQFSLKEQTITTLSSGQKQLLHIALALLQDAQMTIFDEPTANLDPQNTKKIYNIIKKYYQQKIVITHDLNLAYHLGYDILYLKKGRMQFFGSVNSFFAKNFYENAIEVTPTGVLIKL